MKLSQLPAQAVATAIPLLVQRHHSSCDQPPTVLEVSFVSGAPPLHFCVPQYLLVISLKELQEAGLSTRGALHSAEAQVIADPLHVLEIHAKILNPKTATFPNRGQLSRPANNPKRTQGSLKPRTYFLKASLLPLIIVMAGKN